MDVVKKIDVPDWAKDKDTLKVMAAIGGGDEVAKSLFVGGCVRNQLMGCDVNDIDIATKFKPEEVIERLNVIDIKTVPTGIDHGTITAVLNGKSFEITTLRKDIKTDGRRAIVGFTDDWIEDATRRDFTFNTLLMDVEGNIFDPLGNGLKDLKKRRFVFVGDASERIKEDYLRILRFFRFYAEYGCVDLDKTGLNACIENADQISTLSRERVTQEFLKIIGAENSYNVLNIMFKNNILPNIFNGNFDCDSFKSFCDFQVKYKAKNLISRLFLLAGNQPRLFENNLRLSHAQKNFLIKLGMANNKQFYLSEKELKKAIFYHGNEVLLQGYLLVIAFGDANEDLQLIDVLQNWIAPKCPITGNMLLEEGYQTGPELGRELEYRTEEWLDSVV